MHTYTIEIISRFTREILRETQVEAISRRAARTTALLYCASGEEPGTVTWEE